MVVALISYKPVISFAAFDPIVSFAAVNFIDSFITVEHIIALIAVDRIVSAVAVNDIVSSFSTYRVGVLGSLDTVGTISRFGGRKCGEIEIDESYFGYKRVKGFCT